MTIDLGVALLAVLAAFAYAALLPARTRGWALLLISLIAIYWLQSPLPIRFSDYIFPTATIILSVVVWWLVRPTPEGDGRFSITREDKFTLLLLIVVIVGMAFNRFLPADVRLTASRPPNPSVVALILMGLGLAGGGLTYLEKRLTEKRLIPFGIALIVLLFILLKTEPLAAAISGWWRAAAGQDVSLASIADLSWLGFSYIAFRLIHTLRDHQTGILPPLSLREFMTYIIFFPAFIAGPIDRAERFAADLRALPELAGLDAARMGEGFGRIAVGLFKKLVVADSLALGLSLSPANAGQISSTPGAWLLLYGYAFRLYFDFSGYTDMAIGIGLLFGIRLPENFKRPYLQTTLARFWQSWHITLSNWVRFYVFSPMSRYLLRRKPRPSPTLIVLSAQLTTMIIIGLWHGVTWNLFIWGVWHGIGLFIHKMWSDRTRRLYRRVQERPIGGRAWALGGWFLTFHFVVLGWVWFVLPEPGMAVSYFGRLVGIG